LYELYFWDNCASFHKSKSDKDESPVECGQLIVRDGNVQWTAYPKHPENDHELRTSKVYETELEELAKD
jgi:hypothetical protein